MNRSHPSQQKPISPAVMLVVAVLWVATIASAMGVVATTQVVRRDVNSLETLRREASQLQVQWGQYLLEQSTWAAYGRVENAAVSELNMMAPTPEEIVMISGNNIIENQAPVEPAAGGQ
ncbi:MAG: cell division protein FtsL [Cellvibrio sp.]|jgi:cell division protein FtsL|uniref:cell division protein FtsL n=1 Tax=Cellvibrio sp. TaxID=1965322 RepID=UPI0031A75BBF